MDKITAYCFALIKACRETNADKMTVNQENVTYLGENIGDWQIVVRKKGVKEWLIWSNEHKGWWCENHRGYTDYIENAGKYSYEEAVQIVRGANYFEGQRYGGKTKGAVVPNEAMVLADWVK